MSIQKKPQFTIVIPTLNEEKYLPNLLSDLVNQTFKAFMVIIVDGNSEDETIRVTKSFEGKLPNLAIINSGRRNVSYQRNLGEKYAKSPWIIFMDADNRLPKYFLEGISYKIKLENPDIFTCYLRVDSKSKSDITIAKSINIGIEIVKIAKYPAAMGAMIGISKKAFEKVIGFDEGLGYREDWEFVTRASDNGLTFKIFQDPTYTYSLRRIRREGILKFFRNYAFVNLKLLMGNQIDNTKDYPMGGMIDPMEKSFFEKYRQNIKKLMKKPRFLKKIQALLQSIDNGY